MSTASSVVSSADLAVVIGRWQLPHLGHLKLFEAALQSAPRVVVVIGSAFRSRDVRNPFTWEERRDMILAMLPGQAERLQFVPVRDYYDDERWARAVTDQVQVVAGGSRQIALIGHIKDATSAYLNRFPAWRRVGVEPVDGLDATALRKVYFGSEDTGMALTVLTPYLHPSTVAYLQAWSLLPEYRRRCDEARAVAAIRQKYTAPHYLAADALVVVNDHVLLIRRGGQVGHGLWALPGGFVDRGERFLQAAMRELREETGYAPLPSTLQAALRDSAVFDHELRSPRGGIVSMAFRFDLGQMNHLPEVKAADDAQLAAWVPVADLPGMAGQFFEDHDCILDRLVGLYHDTPGPA
ncbi:NUDIX domain-containing protein [Hydrogenophaga palleronii]|uniref:NUDIX domain-containing protein n=1 Tax=Hydrogenophaga palleronii TaxID=65655 RepID=UPI0008257F8E|nr:NUDIX domain-containing protein [Hydrogenophaga palleronii]